MAINKIEKVDKEKIKYYFEKINESGERLMSLLNNLLDLSKLENDKEDYTFKTVNILDLLKQTMTDFSAVADEKMLSLKLVSQGTNIQCECDAEKLTQVIRNLVSNAIKFSYDENPITIECNVSEMNARKRISIRMTNRGVKIPDDELDFIFNKFAQSRSTATGAGGTGLGLAISKKIILDHSGKIWAEYSDDNYTTFAIILPAVQLNQ